MNTHRNLAVAAPGSGYVAVPQEALEYWYDDGGADGEAIDVRAIWAALYRNRWLILAVLSLCMGAAVAATYLTAPVYRAAASVQIDQQAAKVLEGQDQDPLVSAQEADRFLQTQLDVLKSRSLAARVADSLGLHKDPSFLPKMGVKAGDSSLVTADPVAMRKKVVGALTEGLSIDLPRNSRVARIQFESRDPALSARVANSYADNYITSNLQRRFDTSSYSRSFLEGQLASTKQKLEDSERQLIAYARSAGLIDASAGMPTSEATGTKSITTASLVQVNEAYSQARAARIQAQQRWASASGTSAMNLPEVLANPTVQQLTQQKALLQASLNEERERRKEGHPAIIQAEAKLAEIDRQINSIAGSIKNSIREQYQVAARQESGLAGSVGQLKGATLSEQDRGVRYNILKREADTNRQLYDGLLQRYRELSAAAGITMNNISVIDRADAPIRPMWPKPLLNLAIGALVGMFLSLLLVFLREKFDDAVRSPDDVERKLNLPLLGSAPLLRGGTSPTEALEDPRSLLSEAHYALRMSLELSSEDGLPKTLLLTSSRQGEGKSTTAYAIARDLALSGKNVLLIDADLRKPSLHRMTGLENRIGLSNLLTRQKELEEAVQTTDCAGLYLLTSGPLPPNPAQLLTGASLKELVAMVKKVFDAVVIDGPPVLGLADAPRLADAVDGTLFVVEANGAHHGHAKAALKRLQATHAKMIGVVLTKFDARKAGYKSDYGYYYYEYGGSEKANLAAQT